jgi:hypothetical protein
MGLMDGVGVINAVQSYAGGVFDAPFWQVKGMGGCEEIPSDWDFCWRSG